MRRLWISGFGVLAGLALILVTVFLASQQASFDHAEAIRWETQAHELFLEAQHTRSALQDAETGQRDYIVTGRLNLLDLYDTGRHEVDASINRLAWLTRDNAAQQAHIGELRTAVTAKLAELAGVIAFERAGDHPNAVAMVVTGRGKGLMSEARRVLRGITEEERVRLGLRHVAAESTVHRDQLFAALLGLVGTVAIIGALGAMIVAFRSTARLQLSAARVASEKLLRMFVDRVPLPIAMFDKDMHYLVTNSRYLKDYGLDEAAGADALVGRSHYEVFQDIPEKWREIHRRVLAGETCSAQDDLFPRAGGSIDRVRWEMVPWHQADLTIGGAVLFGEVVTVRRQAERRQALLLELADRPSAAPRETMAAAAMLLGSHLGAGRAGFVEVDEAEKLLTFAENYTDGTVATAVGTQSLGAFGWEVINELRAGRTVVVTDILSDQRTRAANPAYLAIGTRSLIVVPLVSDQQLRATLYVSHYDPRKWTTDEVQLVEEVAARIWSAVEQARVKEALERTVEAFSTLADGIPTLCWMAEPDGHIYWYNRRWYEYTGTVAADMEGLGWQSLHDPAVLPAVLERWQTSIATGEPFEVTFPLRGADGTFRLFMTRVAPVLGVDAKIRRWLGVSTDVTEAAEREAGLHGSATALRESEARLRVIFETVPVGLVIGEAPSGRIVAGNQQADAIFGRPMVDSPDVEPFREWIFFHPDGKRVDRHEYPMGRALAGETRPEMEVLYQREDGTQRWVRLVAEPLRTGDRITGVVVAALDIDRKTRALEELSQARDVLERRVAEEVQAREAAQVRLAQAEKLSALGQLAGGIAHDFNNVMQAVTGAAGLIVRHADDPARVKRLIATVDDATRRGISVTRRLLAFARRDELRAEPVDVSVLLDGLHEVLAHTLGAAIAVQLDVAPGLLPVLADRGQLEAALVNLATNARDAMPRGGTITLSARSETVSHDEPGGGLAPGGYVRLAVVDTGIGMDAAMLARVMEPFFSTKAQGEGTGLGLPMARGYSEQSGGTLVITSVPGQGTTVTLWLPVTSAAVVRPERPVEPVVAVSRHVPRILLVDDEAIIRGVLAEELADRGYEVMQASRGSKALALLDVGERVDLMISDLSMPGMDGVTLIRAAQVRRPGLPAILLTGYAGDAAALAVGGAITGSFSLLRKPISGAQLSDRVATLLKAPAVH